jgi:2-amino-4-hydroxy-6-hydroxymethyldihydropteridine diphosphokinase
MKTAYLSLGSNLGDRGAHLREAIDRLNQAQARVTRVSPVYETEPMDLKDQGWFLNLAAEVETELFPMQLLARISRIEYEMGRRRTVLKGPRVIDIDILLYARTVVQSPKLEIPHPRMTERRFVLAPLADLAPEARHPVTRRSVREMLADIQGQQIRKLGPLEQT